MSQAAVHDMEGAIRRPQWPPLTVAELGPVLAAYAGIGAPRAVSWHSPRPFAASGLVACAHTTVFIKRHDGRVRSSDDLREEHGFIAHLRAAGVPVAQVLATRDGNTAPATAAGTYEVHALLAHADPYREAVSWSPFASTHHAHAAGHALAGLHNAADGFTAPARHTGLIVGDFRAFGSGDPMEALARRVAAEPALRAGLAGRPWQADLARALLGHHAALAPHLAGLKPLWTHNDLHASNLLWTDPGPDAGVAAILDFGLSNRTCAVFDLATTIERNTVEWLRLGERGTDPRTDIVHLHLALAIIAGYRAARPLALAEARALPFVLPLVHAEFALSELAYFHEITQSSHDSDAAYHDFLLGHAAWFTTSAGRQFQQALADAVA